MPDPLATSIAAFQDLIREAGTVAGFTGAGISTESGVPDFRSPGSPWTRNKPIPFSLFMENIEARREAWRRKFIMDDLYAGAVPTRGHLGIAALVAAGKMPAVITQNIDNLHQASGLSDEQVIELHGNGTYATCLTCDERYELGPIRSSFEATGEPPTCERCGGIVKSATISFGQAMPAGRMRSALALALACDVFVVLGSSLVVHPAATLPSLAKENGARLIIINREPTPLDPEADIVIAGEIGPILSRIANDL